MALALVLGGTTRRRALAVTAACTLDEVDGACPDYHRRAHRPRTRAGTRQGRARAQDQPGSGSLPRLKCAPQQRRDHDPGEFDDGSRTTGRLAGGCACHRSPGSAHMTSRVEPPRGWGRTTTVPLRDYAGRQGGRRVPLMHIDHLAVAQREATRMIHPRVHGDHRQATP